MPAPLPRRRLLGLLAAAGLPSAWAQAATPADDDDPALRAALAGPQRNAANRARDGARHPYETLRFFGLRQDASVLELAPGGGWYTEILAPYLHAQGRLYAAHYPRDDAQAYRRRSRADYEARLAADPALFGRVALGTLPEGHAFNDPALAAGQLDLVLTFRNLHNWLEEGRLAQRLQAVYAALKPGGVFGVVDHRASPGTPIDQQRRSGYLTEELVVAQASAAGLALQARSEVNGNPRDTHDHPDGVWSLPPTLRGGEVGRDRFLAIGESDRFTHRYVKPPA